MAKKIKAYMSVFAAILSIMGTVTFTLFILEESFQTAMFGTWPAQSAGRWDLVQIGADTMQKTAGTIKTVNNAIGWIQPLAFLSYRSFQESAQTYIDSLNAKALANAPDLYVDRQVSMRLRPQEIKQIVEGRAFLLTNGKMGAVLNVAQYDTFKVSSDKFLHLSGTLSRFDGCYVVDARAPGKDTGAMPNL